MEGKIRIAHLIHPVIVPPESDLVIAQPITFETMRIAREFSKNEAEVELFYARYRDEEGFSLPECFTGVACLERSVADVAPFRKRRKLALIRDLLDRLYEASDADYLIYTNVDISLQPYFYGVVSKIILRGYDAFVINRRTIPFGYASVSEIPLMYAQTGDRHPGWDCFIFKRDLYPRFMLGDACIGTDWIGRIILTNMASLGSAFKVFTDLQMTFHIGDTRVWQTDEFSDYAAHNKEECRKTLLEFNSLYGPFDLKKLPGRFLTKF